jgi:phosphinothricin acetyltransferase
MEPVLRTALPEDQRMSESAPSNPDAPRVATEILGFAYAAAYRSRPAYRFAVEDSVYVAHGLGGQGIGSALLGELIARCEGGPWRQMLAVVGDSANSGSIALHRRFGFELVGILRSVGFKHDRWVDTPVLRRALGTIAQ